MEELNVFTPLQSLPSVNSVVASLKTGTGILFLHCLHCEKCQVTALGFRLLNFCMDVQLGVSLSYVNYGKTKTSIDDRTTYQYVVELKDKLSKSQNSR